MSAAINNEQTNKITQVHLEQCVLSEITRYRLHHSGLLNPLGYMKEMLSFVVTIGQSYQVEAMACHLKVLQHGRFSIIYRLNTWDDEKG